MGSSNNIQQEHINMLNNNFMGINASAMSKNQQTLVKKASGFNTSEHQHLVQMNNRDSNSPTP